MHEAATGEVGLLGMEMFQGAGGRERKESQRGGNSGQCYTAFPPGP